MNTRQLIKTLSQPWAIRAASMAVILDASAYEADLVVSDKARYGKNNYRVEDGICIVSVSGVIGKNLPGPMAAFGMVNIDEITAAIRKANADPSVKSIVLDIDSPGGTFTGIPEAASYIRESPKPVYAYSDTLCTSGAYWLASGAFGLFASESSLVGSIGVFVPIADMRRMYEMAGIEMDVIKSGALKAAGYPGTWLTAEQRNDLQSRVDFVFQKFTSFVRQRQSANGEPPDSAMQGQDFYGEQAVAVALVDGICSRAEMMETVKKLQERQ